MSTLDVGGVSQAFLKGLLDSLSPMRFLLFFMSSPQIRRRTIQCFLLNGVIFLGSMALVETVLAPLIRTLLAPPEATAIDSLAGEGAHKTLTVLSDHMSTLFSWLYWLLLIYPVYFISFILNTMWYHDIAEVACKIKFGPRKKGAAAFNYQSWKTAVTSDIYRFSVFVPAQLVQVGIVSFIPYVGLPISAVQLCALYSLLAFEYKWIYRGVSMFDRLATIEQNWAYFLGFGFPVVLATVYWPTLISSGIYALFFPLLILLTIEAEPVAHWQGDQAQATRNFADLTVRRPGLPFFRYHVAALGWLLQRLGTYFFKKMEDEALTAQAARSDGDAAVDPTRPADGSLR